MQKKQGGFIRLVVILVIVLIILGYFGFNIEKILKSPTVSGNLSYIWNLVVEFWDKFLVSPATFVWEKIIVGIWESFLAIIDRIKN